MSVRAVMGYEWCRLWTRPLGWVLAALTMAGMGWEFLLMLNQYLALQVRLAAAGNTSGFTDLVTLPWLALFVIAAFVLAPLLTMGALAGERRGGTLPLLFSAGVSPTAVVLGKYFAALLWQLLILLLLLAMPVVLAVVTHPDWGKLAAAALGLTLALAALNAVGVACSAFAGHPALAAAGAFVVTALLVGVNKLALADGAIGGIANWLALSTHLQPMGRGLVSTDDLVWFALLIGTALLLAIRRVGDERTRGG
ncbi:ABC transporter permease [Oleiagrimonas soli]|uniref:ABC transporter permease n=1 Tax=Oleiagrimonas soli TaxID=1543381 RepID=A0A099CZI0_9GAMM|nr:ABC transporter permease subunit [Oleiagrimonas soli]KGI79066.1 ABC transporter permease [Oleiagrimonas soli]MBB6184736.1 ABC-2 type transport system permease protein [Oleiagrimonas soli]